MQHFISILKSMMLSALPILEQKAAIPLAMYQWGLSDLEAFTYTLIGALLPAPLILLFMPRIINFCRRVKFLKPIVDWYEKRALKKGTNIIKYQLLGLFLFVAIPLPTTGVWTGTTVAALLKLEFKKALLVVMLGAAVCGLILMLFYKGFINIFWI